MKNLIIGDTSQLSQYFPKDYIRISSRNIDFKGLQEDKYDSVYLCFADQRTFIEDNEKEFVKVNYNYTLDVINFFKPISNRVVIYSTCELWNNVEGGVNIDTPFDYNYSPYIKSKELLTNRIKDLRDYNQNVIIIYPFNFNSPFRKGGFLFGKIFDSIINKKKIEIGNTDFNRDLIHPSYIVERSIKAEKDELVGSGNLININKFIRNLYKEMNMVYEDYVTENSVNNLQVKRKEFYCETDTKYPYDLLLSKTVEDIKNVFV
jgi:nucleoside-diphosphate-sugar epimerase